MRMTHKSGQTLHEAPTESDLTFSPLTDQQAAERLAAVRRARTLQERMRLRRGGEVLPPSWPLVREARDERSEQR